MQQRYPGRSRSLFVFALLASLLAHGQELTNKASSITISAGSTLTVPGSISTVSGGSITNNGTLQTSGDFLHDGTLLYSGTGTLELNGSGAQQLTAATLYNLLLSGSGVKTVSGTGATVSNNLSFTGSNTLVSTSSNPITLGSSGTLSETAAGYIDGWIQTTRSVLQSSANNFGGLGLSLTANGGAPGSTTVLRGTGTTAVQSGSGNLGIQRVYTVTPTNNNALNADVVFAYRDGELNSLSESTLILFGSYDDGTTWRWIGQVSRDAVGNTLTMTGINSFGKLTLGSSSSPLPLTWLSFTGQALESGNKLQWVTANEVNTSHFEVERSLTGTSFTSIGGKTAAGNSSSDLRYDYLDPVSSGTYFYRLKQVDRDGRYSYSSVIKLARGGEEAALTATAYPNPFRDRVTVRFTRAFTKETKLSVVLLDAAGTIVRKQEATAGAGQNDLLISGLQGLAGGNYFLQAATADGQRFLVQLIGGR